VADVGVEETDLTLLGMNGSGSLRIAGYLCHEFINGSKFALIAEASDKLDADGLPIQIR
jgi:hypothetical protein